MTKEALWLRLAKHLTEGSSKRFKCVIGCTEDRQYLAMKVTHDAEGYRAYCFRCGKAKRHRHGLRSINQLQLQKDTQSFLRTTNLPFDFTTKIPEEYALWLYKAGIYKDTYKRYNIGWSEGMQRVVLPVYSNEELVYVQARSVIQGHEPKYLNKTASNKETVLFESLESKYLLGDYVVITEDILSAIRTGVYLRSFSTLGTKITDAVAYILSKYKCIIWYDNDNAGIEGGIKVRKKLISLGTDVQIYRGTKDPKHYTNEELQEILLCLIN